MMSQVGVKSDKSVAGVLLSRIRVWSSGRQTCQKPVSQASSPLRGSKCSSGSRALRCFCTMEEVECCERRSQSGKAIGVYSTS